MARIVGIRPSRPPAKPEWHSIEDEPPVSFASPVGSRTLRLADAYEFAMGGYAWHAELLAGERVVRRWNDASDPHRLQPWSVDGRRLALPRTGREGERLILATADGDELEAPQWPPNEHLASVQWSPHDERLLAVGPSFALLLDADGNLVARLTWPPEEYASPLAGWLDRVFFVLSTDPGADLRFYAAEDGALLRSEALDPADVVPYAEHDYRSLPRDFYNLEGRFGTGVGALLDIWSERRFDSERRLLHLSVLRPTAPIARGTLPVEPRWVEVQLGD